MHTLKRLLALGGLALTCFSAEAAAVTKNEPFRFLLDLSGKAPYEENASAMVLISTFTAAVRGQLLRMTASFDLEADMIQSWRWDFTKKAYVLKLRDDLVFHNGRKAGAEDLEFSLLRGFFTEQHTFYRIFLGTIQGVAKLGPGEGRKYRSGIVPGIQVTGPLEVEVRLDAPNPSFLFSLINPYFSLVPKEELNEDYTTWKRWPVGAGPYRVRAGHQDGVTVVERVKPAGANPALVEFHSKVSPVRYDLSYFAEGGEGLRAEFSKFPVTIGVLHFSSVNKLGRLPDFHRAVQFAINRAKLTEGMPERGPVYEFLPKHFWGRTNLADPYDKAKAKAFVAKLPKELVAQTWRIPLFAGKKFSAGEEELTSRLTAQLADVGLKVEFFPSQEKFTSREIAERAPLFFSGRVVDFLDPLIVFAALKKDSPYEFERPLHPEAFEALFARAAKAETTEDRLRSVRELSKFLDEEAVVVPLYEVRRKLFVRPERVEALGNQDQPMTIFLDRLRTK